MATYDLLIFQGVEDKGEQEVALSLGNSGFFTTGIQKVAQTFTKMLLTESGTVANDPAAGTDFLIDLRNGSIRDELTLQASYQAAVIDILNYMSEQEEILPDDETLEEANLVSWDLRPGFLSIQVEIVTAAGASRTYVVPVQTRTVE